MFNFKSVSWLVAIVTLFCLANWLSASYLTEVYHNNAVIRASIPSVGMLKLAVFLFWFVLFLIPSWDWKKSEEWDWRSSSEF